MKTIPFNKDQAYGLYTIIPVDYFMVKGHFWSVDRKFTNKYLIKYGEKYPSEIILEDGILELHDLGIKTIGQENPCACYDCEKGREEVKLGWKPCLLKYE